VTILIIPWFINEQLWSRNQSSFAGVRGTQLLNSSVQFCINILYC